MQAAIADSTRRAYQADMRAFMATGATVPATPEQIASYLAGQGGLLSPFTLARRVVAISKAHRALGYVDPCNHDLVRSTLRGIRRMHGTAQRQVDPLLKEDILAVVDVLPSTTKGVRDRCWSKTAAEDAPGHETEGWEWSRPRCRAMRPGPTD